MKKSKKGLTMVELMKRTKLDNRKVNAGLSNLRRNMSDDLVEDVNDKGEMVYSLG